MGFLKLFKKCSREGKIGLFLERMIKNRFKSSLWNLKLYYFLVCNIEGVKGKLSCMNIYLWKFRLWYLFRFKGVDLMLLFLCGWF